MPGWGYAGEKGGIYAGWGGIVGTWKNPPKLGTGKGGEGT